MEGFDYLNKGGKNEEGAENDEGGAKGGRNDEDEDEDEEGEGDDDEGQKRTESGDGTEGRETRPLARPLRRMFRIPCSRS